jgi:hypothetical protein
LKFNTPTTIGSTKNLVTPSIPSIKTEPEIELMSAQPTLTQLQLTKKKKLINTL